MKRSAFACLGSSIPTDEPIINIDKKAMKSTTIYPKSSPSPQPVASNFDHEDEHKSLPPTPRNSIILPSLHAASKNLITSSSTTLHSNHSVDDDLINDTSVIYNEYQFVFRSRRIESCKYEPYKTLLFIASAQGYHHDTFNKINAEDPRLSPDGVSQCKIVSAALRKAKQSRPDIMYCSSMYRALSTMQLVCPDWYDDVENIICSDLLRPRMNGKFESNKRGNLDELKNAFKKVQFKHIKTEEDNLYNEERIESDKDFTKRIHQFITKFLIPQSELLRTQYGTLKPSRLENIGWNSSAPNTSKSPSPSPSANQHRQTPFRKRVVVVSHRDFLTYLMKNVINDISPELCKEWRHCDLRKVFIYTKQQLGMADIPCYALSNGQYYSPKNEVRFSRNKHIKQKGNNHQMHRSKTPHIIRHRKTKSSSMAFDSIYSQRRNEIATTSSGDILMTNKLFSSHTFTLTTMSAALCNHHQKPIHVGLRTSQSADVSVSKKNDDNDDDEESSSELIESSDDDDDEIRVLNPGDLLNEMNEEQMPSKQPWISGHVSSDLIMNRGTKNDPKIKAQPLKAYKSANSISRTNMASQSNDGLLIEDDQTTVIKPKQHVIIITPPSNGGGHNNHNKNVNEKKRTVMKFSNYTPKK